MKKNKQRKRFETNKNRLCRVLSRIFCLGGESILKKNFEPSGEKNFLDFLGGSEGMLPQKNFENIVFRIG